MNEKQLEFIRIYYDKDEEQKRLRLLLEMGLIDITQYNKIQAGSLKEQHQRTK